MANGLQKVRLDQLDPNPYRHFNTYPISKEKIATLKESIGSTGFWGETVIARHAGKRFEIAFGHHRIEAAREELGKTATVEISVRDLDDAQMLAMMSRENNESYSITADMDMETVRAAIKGFAQGKIELPGPKPSGQGAIAHALSPTEFGFNDFDNSSKSFTRQGLMDLLGIPERRINNTLRNLKLVTTTKVAKPEHYQGLKLEQGAAMSRAVAEVEKKAGKEAATRAAGRISKELKQKDKLEGGAGRHPSRTLAKQIADEEIEKVRGKDLPDINDVSEKIGKAISDFMDGSKIGTILAEICKHKDALHSVNRRSLVSKLSALEKTASKYRAALETDSIRSVK